ncbi:MAG: RsmB/NOP family class I SAM-dependent RNA methyltransferase, partial [Pseudomonadota bacterium]
MTPAARVQAAIEILDEIVASVRDGGPAADVLIARYFRTRRYAGSKDRRAVREVVYDCIRKLGDVPEHGRAAVLGARPDDAALFGTGGHAPAAVGPTDAPAAPGLAPAWLLARLGGRAGPELMARAGIDLRVNTLKTTRDDVAHLGTPIADLPNGLKDAPEDIAKLQEYLDGLVEIQDRGSQHIVRLCAARPGMTVVDLCAGGGGKALGLAADMANDGRIIASDTAGRGGGARAPRAARAGAAIITPRRLDPGTESQGLADMAGGADIVLVDAPCSGTGTWRRNPEAK